MEDIVTLKVEFFASTKYLKSEHSEIVEIEFHKEDIDDQNYVDEIINERLEEWLADNVNSGYEIKE